MPPPAAGDAKPLKALKKLWIKTDSVLDNYGLMHRLDDLSTETCV